MPQIHIKVYANFEIYILINLGDTKIHYFTREYLVSAQFPGRGKARHVCRIARYNDAADPEEERNLLHTSIAM